MNSLIKNAIKSDIITLLNNYPNGVTPTQLAYFLKVRKERKEEFAQALEELQNEDRVILIMKLKR